MSRNHTVRVIWSAATFAAVLVGGAVLARAQAPAGAADRLAEMRHHFIEIRTIHEAVIRGDLEGVREPARRLADAAPAPGLPPGSLPFIPALRLMARRAAEASTLNAASSAAAGLLVICGDCHRSAGTRPAVAGTPRPDVGGIVGHMLEHQEGVDAMARGLFLPSATSWQEGARRLRGSALHTTELPADPKLTRAVRDTEQRVHSLAERAARAETPAAQAQSYAAVLATCAGCHGLHGNVWGPRSPR